MEEMLSKLSETVGGNLPRLLFALGILIGAWLVAVIVAAALKGALKKTTLDEKLFNWLGGGKAKVDSGHVISRTAYWLILLFGVVAFFSKLGMPMVADPIRGMLAKILEYVPQLVSAGVLVLIAFIIATLLRAAISGVLSKTPLDKQLGDGDAKKSLSYSIASTVYWLVFLLFLPMVLEALSLDGLLQPVQTMLDNLLGFLPNLFGAAVILFLGWLAAKIVRQVVTNLLAATGLDRLGERVGVGSTSGKQTLSGLIGVVVYAFILIPVAISALNALQLEAVSAPASQMLSTILSAIPAVFTAALILGVAYMVGRFASGLVAELLARAGFNNLPAKLGLGWKPQEGQRSPSDMAGYLVLITTLFFAAMEAARQLGFEALAQILVQFVEFAGHIFLGLIIFVIGLWVANVAANMIQSSDRKEKRLLATLARVSILLLVSAMALRQMGLADEIINMAFGLLLAAVALASGLAFGLGSREVAGRTVERWSKRIGGDS